MENFGETEVIVVNSDFEVRNIFENYFYGKREEKCSVQSIKFLSH